ncbi:MAG: SDR family oxidoreductase, partial [Actinomycetota bacterium]
VAPGLVETELSALLQSTDEVDADYRINMPLGRRGTPEDVARAVRFLCGPESSWITGVVLAVDGGHHLRRGPNIDPLLAPFLPDLAPPSPPAD